MGERGDRPGAGHRDVTPAGARQRHMRWLKNFHLLRLVVWTVQIPVALLTGLKESVPYVVFLSLAALVEGAFSSWMAALAEESARE